MQKISTMQANGKKIFKGRLTIGLDLGDRFSSYCVLDEAGEILLEHRLPTTPEAAMKQTFGRMPRPHGRGNSSLCPSTSRSYSYSGSQRQNSSAFIHSAVLQHTSISSLFSWFVVTPKAA